MLESLLKNPYEIAAIILFGIGFTSLMLQKNMIKKIIGFGMMDSAIYLFLAAKGFIEGRKAPIVVNGVTKMSAYINPIPSGLVLTGIVVSVSITAFSLALIQRIYHRYGTIELDELLEKEKKEDE